MAQVLLGCIEFDLLHILFGTDVLSTNGAQTIRWRHSTDSIILPRCGPHWFHVFSSKMNWFSLCFNYMKTVS